MAIVQVNAILQAASTDVTTDETTSIVSTAPAAVGLSGSATSTTWIAEEDLAGGKMKYGYLAYQVYTAASGAQGLASATGTSDWVDVTGISIDFPDLSITSSVTTALDPVTADVTFTISSNVQFTKTAAGIYSVTTDDGS